MTRKRKHLPWMTPNSLDADAEWEVVPFMVDIAPYAEAALLLLVAFPAYLKPLNVGEFLDIAREVRSKFFAFFFILVHRRFILLVVGLLELHDGDVGDDGILEFGR